MNVVLIYNAKSGSNYTLSTLRRLFKAHGMTIEYSFTVKQLASIKLKNLIKKGVIVAAVGGDGTLNSVARLVVDTKSTLLPLPGGTFNHFIRDTGMSPNLEEVLAGISKARERMIDVAMVNDELFLNNSNLGLYPFSLIERKTTKKYVGKYVAAVLSAFDQLSIFHRHRLIIDGKPLASPFVFVGNNVYDIKQSLIPQRTQLNKGVLTVMVATARSRRTLIRDAFAVIRGDVTKRDQFSFETREELTIESRKRTLPVSLDGEVVKLKTPLRYRSRPKSLRILTVKAK